MSSMTMVKFATCLGLVGPLAVLVSGCTQLTPPNTAVTAPVVTVTRDGTKVVGDTAPRKTGTYPTFSTPLTAASAQMTDKDAQSMQAQLEGLAAARQAGTVSEAQYQAEVTELRKLAAEHGAQTQAEIAN